MPKKAKKKKGFYARAKGAARRGARYVRRVARRKVRMGLIGKTGVLVAGGVPPALAAIDSVQTWLDPKFQALSIYDKLRGTIYGFANNLGLGFLGTSPFPTVIGTATLTNSAVAGAYAATTATGIGLVVIDGVLGAITRIASGGRARPRFMGRQLISG